MWILAANAWMQNPVGAEFNIDTMRMEVTSFSAVFFNPVAQSKFVHTVSAGYVLGAMFVLSISAWYLLRGRNIDFAKRSMTVAASFGLAAALSVVVLGDESGYTISENQKMKLAAIEAMWETEPPPASFTVFGIPDVAERKTHYAIHIPWVMGLIGTRSLDGVLPGISQLVEETAGKIENGRIAYAAMQKLRANRDDAEARAQFEAHKDDLGYALLLLAPERRPADGDRRPTCSAPPTARFPNVPVLFWSFRIMVACGFYFIALFAYSFWLASKRQLDRHRWYLRMALWSLPLPWVAAELGWIVAEHGRQPWAIEGILPTALGVSSVSASPGLDQPDRLRDLLHRAGRGRRVPDGCATRARARMAWPHVAGAKGAIASTTRTLRDHLVAAARRAAAGFAIMDGFDLGVAALVRVLGPRRRRTPRPARNDRADLGRQPGLAHPRRRRRVRRVAAALCGGVLRLLLRHAAGAARPDPAPGRLQLPQQGGRSALAQHLGLGPDRLGRSCRR